MESRLRGQRNGPTIIYDTDIPPHPYLCNRGARRMFTKSGMDHTKIPMTQLKRVNLGGDKKPIYFMGEERFIPPYLWKRVKQKKSKGESA